MIFVAIQTATEGDFAAAHETFGHVAEIASRYQDANLTAGALMGMGRCLIWRGETAAGVALLDEVMVGVTADEVSPLVAGDIYCGVIEACHEIFDLRRAQEWTNALSRWCDAQPDLVLYRGRCMVHRAQILQLRGSWPAALGEVERACERLADPPNPAIGEAFYQLGELHRLHGAEEPSEAAFLRASEFGRPPYPGLAQLRLAQGKVQAAAAAITRALNESRDPFGRAMLLPAFVEIQLAGGDAGAARAGVEELRLLADDTDAPLVRAWAAHALGAVLLAGAEPADALVELRRSLALWTELGVPYEAARTRLLVGLACGELGDAEGSAMEVDGARSVFRRLGATPDLTRLEALTGTAPNGRPAGLTSRETEVLRLVASGRTNRAIAAELVISEHTVARHVQNIFTKLSVSSRAAATASAFELGLV